MTSSLNTYSQDDIQQILNLAIARQAHDEAAAATYVMTREQLLEIAEEMHIPIATLNAAEQDWQEKKGVLLRRRDFDLYRTGCFQKAVLRYFLVSGVCALPGLLFGWWGAPLGITFYSMFLGLRGMSLVLRYWDLRQTQGDTYEQEFQSWYRRYQMRYVMNTWVGRVSRFLGASSH
jgi:hypothetical protein